MTKTDSCLTIAQDSENSIKLSRGFFHVTLREVPHPETTKKLLGKWYSEKMGKPV